MLNSNFDQLCQSKVDLPPIKIVFTYSSRMTSYHLKMTEKMKSFHQSKERRKYVGKLDPGLPNVDIHMS